MASAGSPRSFGSDLPTGSGQAGGSLQRTSGPHQNIRYKSIQHNFIATCFSQNHACIFYKRYLHIQNVIFLLLLRLLYTLSYIYTTQRLGLRILERSLGFSTCT